jgi:LacI family transcriptional regulator
MPVTIKQISNELGLSPATVSLAIRNKKAGKKRLSPETVNLVQETARRMGYRPNTLATSLLSSTSTTVGVLLGSLSFGSESLLDGFKMSFGPDYTSFLSVYNGEGQREKSELEMLIGHRVCGLIAAFSGASENISLYKDAVLRYKIPLVTIERQIPGLHVPLIRSDHFNSTYLAARALQELGHKRIMYASVSFSVSSEMSELHSRGYYKAMHEAGLEDCICVNERRGIKDWYKSGNLRAQVSEIMKTWLLQKDRSTAVLVDHDWLAYEILSECSELGIRIPEDLSLMGIGDYVFSSFPYVNLSTVASAGDYPMQTMIGREAAKLLMQLVAGGEWDGNDIILPVKVVLRSTTREI